MFGLTNKEIVELRIKCLEPFVAVASKANIEQDTIMKKAEIAWEFAIGPLMDNGLVGTTGIKSASQTAPKPK